MPEMIRDGSGRGYTAEVTDENRLLVGAVSVTKEHHTNFSHQDSYNILFNITPTGAGDYFLYVKNTSIFPIVCEGFSVRCVSDEVIRIKLDVLGTPSGGSDVVPANLTAGAGNQAIGTFQEGSNITGLTGGITVAQYYIEGSNESKFRNFDADIVVPQNETFVMFVETGGIQCDGFLVMWHDHGGV